MIQPVDFQSDTIVGLRMTGKITEADIAPWASRLDARSNQPGKLRAYIEYENVDNVTLRAAVQDLKFDITHLGDFEKAALVADQQWTNLAAFVANLLPNLEVRQFSSSEREQARAWITA